MHKGGNLIQLEHNNIIYNGIDGCIYITEKN